jgi:mannosyltransferase OCH1-like enzyme
MIPRTIHYCWFGRGSPNALMRRCLQSWRRYMPRCEIVEWNDGNTPFDSNFVRAARRVALWAHVSDYVRLCVLQRHGGIYLDTDVELRQSLDPLRVDQCFAGFQLAQPSTDWVNNAVLGAEPGHPFLADCLQLTVRHFEVTGRFPRSPTVTTQVLRMYGLREYGLQELGGVTVYPTTHFYPYPWFESFREECVSSSTYAVHFWEGSWRRTNSAARSSA